ncbi:MAG: aldo/keto reductase [Peptoniphilaceae bacterium]|nr:aldo/keto reductase [Peptoniphilaceae bacterium]MDY6019248.1 aldo/keto reductase [Anaerococcus sp.]
MIYFKLNDGNKVPALGLGTYKITDRKDMEEAVQAAFENGYTYFDTAAFYENEDLLGLSLKNSPKKREDYQIATKVWPTMFGESLTKKSIDNSLKALQTDYIDIIHLHWYGKYFDQAWKVFEDYKRQGIVKSIAVCNFNQEQLNELSKIGQKPVMDQLESNPYLQNNDLVSYLNDNKIIHQAWSPLARGKDGIFNDPILVKISKKYNKSPAQLALRWNIQRQTMVIPKSLHKNRIKENISIFDFTLTNEEMEQIKSLDKNLSHSHRPDDEAWLKEIGRS